MTFFLNPSVPYRFYPSVHFLSLWTKTRLFQGFFEDFEGKIFGLVNAVSRSVLQRFFVLFRVILGAFVSRNGANPCSCEHCFHVVRVCRWSKMWSNAVFCADHIFIFSKRYTHVRVYSFGDRKKYSISVDCNLQTTDFFRYCFQVSTNWRQLLFAAQESSLLEYSIPFKISQILSLTMQILLRSKQRKNVDWIYIKISRAEIFTIKKISIF